MSTLKTKKIVEYNGLVFTKQYDDFDKPNVSFVNRKLPASLKGTLTTRTSGTTGSITTLTTPTGIATNDLIGISWITTKGVLAHRIGEVTGVAGNVVSFNDGFGTSLPSLSLNLDMYLSECVKNAVGEFSNGVGIPGVFSKVQGGQAVVMFDESGSIEGGAFNLGVSLFYQLMDERKDLVLSDGLDAERHIGVADVPANLVDSVWFANMTIPPKEVEVSFIVHNNL